MLFRSEKLFLKCPCVSRRSGTITWQRRLRFSTFELRSPRHRYSFPFYHSVVFLTGQHSPYCGIFLPLTFSGDHTRSVLAATSTWRLIRNKLLQFRWRMKSSVNIWMLYKSSAGLKTLCLLKSCRNNGMPRIGLPLTLNKQWRTRAEMATCYCISMLRLR